MTLVRQQTNTMAAVNQASCRFGGTVAPVAPLSPGGANWYALLVRSRHEFAASQELGRKGVEAYVPAQLRLRQWKDRKKIVHFPLFPGYIFVRVCLSAHAFFSVMETRGVVRFVSLVPGKPTPLRPDDVDSLKRMLSSSEELDVYAAIQRGTRVRVKRGPLSGSIGIIAKREDHFVFLINFELLGRSVGVKIYADDIEQA